MASEENGEDIRSKYFKRRIPLGMHKLYLLSASGFTIGAVYLAYKHGSFIPVPSSAEVAVRIGYTCKCLALPCLSPLVSITECIGGRVRSKVWPMTGRDHLLPQLEKNVLVSNLVCSPFPC